MVKVIIFEGLDGTGKSVVSKGVADILGALHIDSPLPEFQKIRSYLHGFENQDANFHFYLSSNLILSEYFKAAEKDIVCSRYYYSSIIDYSAKNKKSVDNFMRMKDIRHSDFYKPDHVFLLTVNPIIQLERINKRNHGINSHTDFLSLTDEGYRKRCFENYRALADKFKWEVIDTTHLSIDEVIDNSLSLISKRL